MPVTPVKVDSRWTFDPTAEDTIRISVLGVPGTPGATGNTGPAGADGPAGPGVSSGGTAGQLLAKIDGTNYNTHWITASGTGTVTSVGLSLPVSMFSVANSPVTSSGTLTASFVNFSAHTVLIGPTTGPATTPTVRVLQASDLPSDVAYTDVVNIFSASQRIRTGQSGQPAFSIDAGHSQYNWISFTENDGLGTFVDQATLGYFPNTQQLIAYAPAGLRGGFVDDGSGTTVIPQSGITGLVSALAGKQPLDGDLTAISALSGTNTIYYRSAADTWTAVTVGSGLSFSGGTLASTSGGGSVTTVSVVSANGFAGTVANPTSTPAITLTTTITGILKGNGTAISAATADTDYLTPATATSTYQPKDATLTSLAAFNTNGLITQTAADTFTGRTLTGTTNKIDVSNGDGVSGNPTVTISSGYVGQTSITTLGTITSGTWNATIVGKVYGGTGEDNSTGGTANTFWSRPNGATGAATYRAIVAADVPTLNQNTTGSAATLTTPRAIYGNNFDGSAALTQVIASTYGGTGNGFTKFSGPTTSEKTFTLPNADCTVLTTNAAVTVAQGGTGAVTLTAHAVLLGEGTSTLAFATIGTAGRLLIDQGASTDPAFTVVSGDATINSSGVVAIGSGKVTNTMLAGSIDLTTKVTGALSIANGGTASTTAATARNSLGLDVIAASVYFQTPTDSTIVISAKAAFAFTINEIRGLKTSSGTLTLAIKINGTNVTSLSSLSVTSTPQDVSATGANSVAIGDRITAVISSSSTPTDLEFTLKATR